MHLILTEKECGCYPHSPNVCQRIWQSLGAYLAEKLVFEALLVI